MTTSVNDATTVVCAECGHEFELPAVAICPRPECRSRQIRRVERRSDVDETLEMYLLELENAQADEEYVSAVRSLQRERNQLKNLLIDLVRLNETHFDRQSKKDDAIRDACSRVRVAIGGAR